MGLIDFGASHSLERPIREFVGLLFRDRTIF